MIIRLITVIGITITGAFSAFSQTYSDDLADVEKPNNPLTPIGNIGELERIIDLRGFVPLSFYSKKKTAKENLLTKRDSNQWFKIPTRQGVQWIYYGFDDNTHTTQATPIVAEDALAGDDRTWALFAYEIAAKQGESLYKVLGDGKGFEGTEPISVLFTKLSAIVVVNLRYTDWDSEGTGQFLVALEFSRSLHNYKTFYLLYTDGHIRKSTRELFKATAPLVDKALGVIFPSK